VPGRGWNGCDMRKWTWSGRPCLGRSRHWRYLPTSGYNASVCSPPGRDAMTARKKLELTPEEQRSLEQDAAGLDVLTGLNGPNAAVVSDLFPEATPPSEVEYWAALGNLARLKVAINNGCDVNAIGKDGWTALHAAAENGRLEAVRLLVEQGA